MGPGGRSDARPDEYDGLWVNVIGTMIGLFATSTYLSVLFLALAAGALLWVINEMFGVAKKLNSPPSLGWGLLTGFLVAYSTDLLLTYLTLG